MDLAVLGRVHAPAGPVEAVAAIVVQRFAAVAGLPLEVAGLQRELELEVLQMAVVTPLCIPGEYVASVVAL